MKLCSKCGERPRQKGSTGTWCNECANASRRNRRYIRSRAQPDPFDVSEAQVPAEQRLWAAALTIKLRDASGDVTGQNGGESKALLTRRAKNWIGSRDFELHCLSAGFDPDFVLDAYHAGKFTKEHWKKYAAKEECTA